MRLFIGVPSAGTPAAPFLEALASLRVPSFISEVQHGTVIGNYAPAARELLLRNALRARADLLLMCDDDMVVPSDALEALTGVLNAHTNCALAGALYYSRDGLRPMALDHWSAADTTSSFVPAFDDRTPVNVDGLGFGCVLLDVRAIDALRPPYFSAQIYIEERKNQVRLCNEDYLFCARLRKAGFAVMLHPGVRAGHYDRASGKTFPLQWETVEQTNRARAPVIKDGQVQLVAYDETLPRAREEHAQTSVEYIFVDS